MNKAISLTWRVAAAFVVLVATIVAIDKAIHPIAHPPGLRPANLFVFVLVPLSALLVAWLARPTGALLFIYGMAAGAYQSKFLFSDRNVQAELARHGWSSLLIKVLFFAFLVLLGVVSWACGIAVINSGRFNRRR
jgi:hypothetical protein